MAGVSVISLMNAMAVVMESMSCWSSSMADSMTGSSRGSLLWR